MPVRPAALRYTDDMPAAASGADHRRDFLIGFAIALTSAALFSGKAIVVKLTYRYQVDAITVLALRMVLSLPFFAAAAAWSAWRTPGAGKLSRGDWLRVMFLGLSGYYLASYLDFLGLQYITAALERLILFLYPTVVMLVTTYLLRRRVSRQQVLALAISYAGIGIVFAHDLVAGAARSGTDAGAVAIGASFVFGSAVSYALYLVASGEIVKRVGSIRLTAYATIVASVLCIAQFVFTRDLGTLTALAPQVWGYSLFNAVFCTVVPVFGTMLAIARIGAPRVSMTGMVGPVMTIFLGALVLGEPITWWQMGGTVFVLAGVFLTTRNR